MLLNVDIEVKTIGNKELFHDLRLSVEPHEKVAVIGRNGVGKTTLFQMLAGLDTDYTGTIQTKRGTRLVSTAQEHHAVSQEPVLQYILQNLPEYKELKQIIDTYPAIMGDSLKKITTYSNALLVITHDRDVLKWVEKIIEIKEGKALVFKGNYEAYLKQNTASTALKIHDYQVGLQTLDNLHKKIMWARRANLHGMARPISAILLR